MRGRLVAGEGGEQRGARDGATGQLPGAEGRGHHPQAPLVQAYPRRYQQQRRLPPASHVSTRTHTPL